MTDSMASETAGVVALGTDAAFASWARKVFDGPVWVRETLPDALRAVREAHIDCVVVYLPDCALEQTRFFEIVACASPGVVILAASPSRIEHSKELELLSVGVSHCLSISAGVEIAQKVVSTLRDQMGRVGDLNKKVRRFAGALAQQEVWQEEAKTLISSLLGHGQFSIKEARQRSERLLAEDFSIPESTGQIRRPVGGKVQLREICSDVVDTIRPQARAQGVDLVLQSDSSVPEIWAERRCVTQLMTNLLSNSLRHTEQGGTIHVDLEKAASPLDPRFDGCHLSVRDTGAGIAESHLSKIFNAGFTTENNESHAGIGLTICKRVMDDHGGNLSLESEEGKGTTVRCRFPVDARQRSGRVRVRRLKAGMTAQGLLLALNELGSETVPEDVQDVERLAWEMMIDGGSVVLTSME
ncbi:MAG: HAMP domain-containing histidine kinase [Deltaproteobacteria bacterium]|nr:HAMP domain-containing histidine kinase [Deltaproteobacteria bacterium]